MFFGLFELIFAVTFLGAFLIIGFAAFRIFKGFGQTDRLQRKIFAIAEQRLDQSLQQGQQIECPYCHRSTPAAQDTCTGCGAPRPQR